MKSHTTPDFRRLFNALPEKVQEDAKKAYRIFQNDPSSRSLDFKKLKGTRNLYSARVGAHYRAVGILADGEIIWYWIGPHSEYDRRF